ncbi:MAG: NYN domain-containing protein [Rhodocyclaceae bacterium]|nr:NYN domain-containing protein [Rhodocyclaceae bacterium]
MAGQSEIRNMALFCDFENVALGVQEAKYPKFDIAKVLERLLLKGSIVVKKAYCDWERYKNFKAGMHEAAFELIEIPHVRQSGKNSADIRMVVDALDLCYTKSHVDTFVIISGDSDFSPLVSKLRENNKLVIGVGVKKSTSDLLTANCDDFIFYDDLVREEAQKKKRTAAPAPKKQNGNQEPKTAKKTVRRGEKPDGTGEASGDSIAESVAAEDSVEQRTEETRRVEALELTLETVDALQRERGEEEKLWGSMVKQALKRRKPGFNESYYGYRSFNDLLKDAESRGMLRLAHDEKSGGYLVRSVPRDE